MPFINSAPIDASGNLLVTTTVPTAAWPSLGGFRYDPVTSALAVIDAVPAAGDPFNDGLRFTNVGQLYVWSAGVPTPLFYTGGLPVTADGRLVVNGAGGGGTVWVGGWPISGSGGVPVTGLAAQPIFFAPLQTTLVPTTAGNPTFTFTRATLAYAMDFEGVLRQGISNEARFQGARRVFNVLTNSGTLTAAASWTVTNATSVVGATDPLGGTTAYTLTATAANAVLSQLGFPPNATNTLAVNSVWLRRRTGTGTVLLIDPRNTTDDITARLTSAWQRFASSVWVTPGYYPCGVKLATSGDAVDVWHPQAENIDGQSNQAPGEYVSVGVLAAPYHGNGVDGVKYFPTTNGNSVAANVVTEAAGTAIPLATTLGYVAENAATNLCMQSQTFDNATAWAGGINRTITADNIAAPDGTLTADRFLDDATSGLHFIGQSAVGITNAQTYTLSVYVKQGTLPWVQIAFVQTANAWANFNLATGAVGNSAGTTATSVQTLPNGWYRCSITFTANAANQIQIFGISTNAAAYAPAYVGTGQTMYLWGAQVEQASDPSSYILTTTVAVMRNVDNLQYQVASNVSGALATTYLESYPQALPAATQSILLSTSAQTGYPQFFTFSGLSLHIYSGPEFGTANGAVVRAVNKSAVAWSGATASACLNGGAVATGAFTPYASSGTIGSAGVSTGLNINFAGAMRNVKFYSVRLTDAEIQGLTQ